MAILPSHSNGNSWLIISINRDVHIIENPGQEDERTHLQFSEMGKTDSLVYAVEKIREADVLEEEQKYWATFWCGYFYANLFDRR